MLGVVGVRGVGKGWEDGLDNELEDSLFTVSIRSYVLVT